MESRRDSFDEQEKIALGRMYIDKFRSEVARMVEQKGLAEYMKFTDKHLRFLDGA